MNTRRTRDKDKTIEDILSASSRLFSERGLHGTSFRDIENASGVSKGLILHHFGSKEALYAAVQNRLTEEYINMMVSQRQKSTDLREMITTAIRSSFQHTKNNRDHRRIVLWSYLEGQERNSEIEQRFIQALAASMQAGQEAGLVRDDIDATLMPFIIKGAMDYWIRKEELIQKLFEQNESQDGNRQGGGDDRLIAALSKLFLK